MNIIDIIIIFLILLGFLIGFKRGFTRELVSLGGIFTIVMLSFILKNPISCFLYEHLPFFGFFGLFKGITVLNIALYEIIAFFITMSVLIIIFRVLVFATSVFEKVLNLTIILGIPSKILGAILGMIESYIWIFIILYIATLPIFNLKMLEESKYKDVILKNTPILSNFVQPMVNTINEFEALKQEFENNDNAEEFNKNTLELFLKYDVITVNSVEKLVEKNKLKINNVESILSKYR